MPTKHLMELSPEEVQEFCNEALELLDQAEPALLSIEKGASFADQYDAIFRVFHSLKGGAGMLGLNALQNHMHQLENFFSKCRTAGKLLPAQISYFLNGVDAARKLLNNQPITFNYDFPTANDSSKANSNPATTTTVAAPASAPAPTTSKRSDKTQVYLVDDEPELLMITKEILEAADCECQTFQLASHLLEAIKKQIPDVVVSDMNMPKMTGLDMLKQIKAIAPDLPVIFLSGFLSKEVLINAIGEGLFGAIEKPCNYNVLINMVMNAARYSASAKLLNQSIHLIMYQFADLEDFLIKQGKQDIANSIKKDLDALMEQKQKLRKLSKVTKSAA